MRITELHELVAIAIPTLLAYSAAIASASGGILGFGKVSQEE
jgi:hypothetical protein